MNSLMLKRAFGFNRLSEQLEPNMTSIGMLTRPGRLP